MIEIKDLTYTYPGKSIATLRNVNIDIPKGEFVLLTGPTGCGKSTLLKTINGLIPHLIGGKMEGKVEVAGLDTRKADVSSLSQIAGMIFQSPDDQIFSTVVQDEVAFGPENLALPGYMIRKRVDEALDTVGLDNFHCRATHMLSGGQKQRLAIASVMSMAPKVLLLDEPFAQLDPQGTSEVLSTIRELNENGMTVILVEHRIYEVAHVVSRVMVMDNGGIVLDDEPERALKEISNGIKPYLNPPDHQTFLLSGEKDSEETALEMKGVSFQYDKGADFVLKGVNLRIKRGEVVSLMGNNGSGKSTILLHFTGLLRPSRGQILVFGRDISRLKTRRPSSTVGFVFQNPNLMLFNETVWQEIAFGPKALGLEGPGIDQKIDDIMTAMDITELRDENPLALSGGQRLRVAIASILSMGPEIILLDEPTSGQDKSSTDGLLGHLYGLSKKGITILFTTHDIEAAIRWSDRLLVMNGGRIIADGLPVEVARETRILKKAGLRPPLCLEPGNILGIEAISSQGG